MVFAVLWMTSAMVLVCITPKPLSPLLAVIAVVPMFIVGAVVNFQCWAGIGWFRRKPDAPAQVIATSDT
jgi:hypothetical protein